MRGPGRGGTEIRCPAAGARARARRGRASSLIALASHRALALVSAAREARARYRTTSSLAAAGAGMKRKGSGDGDGHDRRPSQRQRHQPKQPRLERNTEGLHVLLSTLRCAHSGCTPPLNYTTCTALSRSSLISFGLGILYCCGV